MEPLAGGSPLMIGKRTLVMKLPLQTVESAPVECKQLLEAVKHKFGFIPNLYATLANSAPALNGYEKLYAEWERCSLSRIEQFIVLLAASVENSCPYCIAGYSHTLKHLQVGDSTIVAIQTKNQLPDAKLNALVRLVREAVSERGFVSEATKSRFVDAGYSETAAMEVLMGIALKTMANYLDHINPLKIDSVYLPDARQY
jgi:alkylhydroperoxidase family enzyme